MKLDKVDCDHCKSHECMDTTYKGRFKRVKGTNAITVESESIRECEILREWIGEEALKIFDKL